MKALIFIVLIFFSSVALAQKTAKVDTTQNKVNEALCDCIGKQDISKITTREQAATIFDNCIYENGTLIFKLAHERNVDINDRRAMLGLANNIGRQLREQFCLAAEELFFKVSDIIVSAEDKRRVQEKHSQDSIYSVNIKRDAEAMIKTIMNDDMAGLIKYLYPAMVEKEGGATKMIETLKLGTAQIKRAGVTMSKATIGEPYAITRGLKNLYAFVPEKTFAVVKGENKVITSIFFAVSVDNGSSWFFIASSGLDQEEVSNLFPDFKQKQIFRQKSTPASVPK